VGDLTDVSAYTTTPLGKVSSNWVRDHDTFTLDVTVPVGSTATVLVPVAEGASVSEQGGATYVETSDGYATFEVGSGDYTFTTG
jgi:alpha-L-rhamnosidase